MPSNPQISCYLYNTRTPVDENHPAWLQPLPMTRHFAGDKNGISVSHGEYFVAVCDFLENNKYGMIVGALEKRLGRAVKPADITKIHVGLVKHGEFYHPARVDVTAGGQSAVFVLNVAVSDAGNRTINREYSSLKRLTAEFDIALVPRVYGFGEVRVSENRTILMFLGDWLEGYHEFHVSDEPSGRDNHILVWDEDGHRFSLSREQQAETYRQAARILTYYYNVETFEQISGWHHAAGDFIVRVDTNGLDLKLITVRRYAPQLSIAGDHAGSGPDAETMLQALMLFFLNLSIRMRLDRIDGVGEIIWADRFTVDATVKGFFEGLTLKEPVSSLPDSIDRCFAYFLSVCTAEDIEELCQSVSATFDRRAPEASIIRQNLAGHITSLHRSIRQFLNPS